MVERAPEARLDLKQDRFTTCFRTCGTNSWVLLNDRVENFAEMKEKTAYGALLFYILGVSFKGLGGWGERVFIFLAGKSAHFDANVQNERSWKKPP